MTRQKKFNEIEKQALNDKSAENDNEFLLFFRMTNPEVNPIKEI